MTDRLEGYMAEIAYPAFLTPATTPARIAGALALQGVRPPDLSRPFRLLDLGCGDGVALAAIAASHPAAAFEGIDGAAAHVAAGNAFAGRPENLALAERTFGEALAEGGEAAEFVTAQGVLAWVAPRAREALFDLAALRLAPGGVFSVGYNAMPGWAGRLALRRALGAFAAGAAGGPVGRFDVALARIEELGAALQSLPDGAAAWLRRLRGEAPAAYFPHEWLNEGWAPLWSDEAKAMAAARGLFYAGQSGFDRIRPDLTLRKAQREALEAAPEAARDGLVDLFRDTAFRVDLYVRDAREDRAARDRLWLAAAVGPDSALVHDGPAGRLRFDNPAARHLLGALAEGPAPFAGIAETAPFGRADLRNALDCLLIAGFVRPAAPPASETGPARRFNEAVRSGAEAGSAPIRAFAGRFGPVEAKADELLAATPSDRLRRLGIETF